MAIPHPPLELPIHVLQHITGDRRKRLVDFFTRWGEYAAALACVDTWLAQQPQLATLREMRALLLIEQGQAQTALDVLDEIDAERGMSVSRRTARVRALAALGQFEAAHALLPAQQNDITTLRQRAELFRHEGRFAEAADLLAAAAAQMPDGAEPTRALAELALARGEYAQAAELLHARIERAPDVPATTRDMLLLYEALLAQRATSAATALAATLAERRVAEQQAVVAELGLEQAAAAEPVASAVALLDQQQEGVATSETLAALRQHFGFEQLRPGQATVIERVLRGERVLGVLPTGAGKSLTYQLPALMMQGATLVISPLIALMKDQIDNLPPTLAEQATTINSSLEGSAVAARLRGIAQGQYKLIFIAPERLRQQPFVQALKRVGVARVVIDEAHCVSLWGMSFRPDYLFIRRALDELGNPPVLGLTATATPETEIEIKTHLGELETVRTSIFRPNLRFEVVNVPNKLEKLNAVRELCAEIDGPMVVYVRSREGCEEVADYLRRKGESAEHYHAQVEDRAAVQDRFMRGDTRVLVATVAFGMGVDKADVRAILHYNLPQSVEAYYQEAGRAGRDGLPARCVMLYASTDKGQLTGWLREDALTKDYLREIYRQLRRQIGGRWGVVSLEQLRRELREYDETRMRVALGLLERVGLLERHFDLPRTATITLRDQFASEIAPLIEAAGLQQGAPTDVDLIDLAEQLGCAPDALERDLIDWHTAGLLRYAGSARDVLLEMRPASGDVGAHLDALLGEYAERQNQRVEAIAAYARSARCRHRTIAEHFGEQMPPCGSACDICAPAIPRQLANANRAQAPRAIAYAPAMIRSAALAVLGELPGQLGEKDLVCVLLGMPGYPTCSSFGQLAGAEFAAVRGVVSGMLADGKLALRQRALVVAHGITEPAGPALAREAVLRCLGRLPFAVGKSGLAKILKGAAGSPVGPDRCVDFAALAHMTGAAIEAEIERMVDEGALRRSQGQRPLLMLADQPMDDAGAEGWG